MFAVNYRDELFFGVDGAGAVDLAAVIFDNLICRGRLTKDYFMWVLNLFVISKNKIKFHYKELLQISIDHLNDESQKLRASINNLLVNLERD